MSRIFASLLSALFLAGCGVAGAIEAPKPEVKPVAPRPVAECLTPPPKWEPLPERDVRRSELARLWRLNGDRFDRMAAERRVCRAGLTAKRRG